MTTNQTLFEVYEEGNQTAICLKQAEAYERRLLRPHTRSIVSPLTVKRRMKPKVELQTKSRKNTPDVGQNASLRQSQRPRFGFSGKATTSLSPRLL